MLFFVHHNMVVGSTEEEAKRKRSEAGPGTFREKMFNSSTGPLLNDRHPAARRRQPRTNG